MKRVLLAAGIIAVLVVIGIVVANNGSSSKSSTTGSSTLPSQSTAQSSATITYDSSGFHPSATTVKSGGSVTFTNTTTGNLQVDSNPHPVHTDDTDLNVGTIEPGQSKTVVLTKKGTYGFHNHLMPSDTAQITIE